MSATIHIVAGPPGADRTTPLLDAFRAARTPAFGSALFLTRTRRHADQARERLLTATSPASLAPRVFHLQAFADELVRACDPALRPLSDLDRRLLLDSVLAELREAGELAYFASVADTRGFATSVDGYVRELKAAGVDLRQLLKASGDRKTPELNRHAQATRVFDRYHRRLGKLHRLDPADRLGRAAELWADGRRGPFVDVRVVCVNGFTSLAPFEQTLLDALRETAEQFWIGVIDGDGEAFTGPNDLRAWASSPVGERTLFNPGPEVQTEPCDPPDRPAGLRRLAMMYSRPASPVEQCEEQPDPDATGLHLIEAPGLLGEARLIARRVRVLLAAGVPPARIVVTARHLPPATLELFREVFDEYAIPHEAEGADPLARCPAVAFLLKAWRLADDDWPFAGLAAVLRSTYFRPTWPEVQADPEIPAKAEALLRMLGETRGRDSYLQAVREWEHTPPAPLEDEQAEEPLRKRKQRLATRCRPFLERFFRVWDRLKPAGSAESFVGWLRAFADDTGLSRASDPGDADGLARFWHELARWAKAESAGGTRRPVRVERFARVLAVIASTPCLGRSPRDGSRLRLLSAEAAAGLECDYLFLTRLGEGSWPNLSGPESLLDDGERQRLRKAGFDLPDPAARLGSERLLFLELIATPRRELILSYAAVDEQGQPLLPSTFLREVKACFPAGAIPITRQRMLIEGYFTREPMSAVELRVQAAHAAAADRDPRIEIGSGNPAGASGLRATLERARALAEARFRSHTFGPYDGELRHPAVAAELARRFDPARILSPTALEAYVACPFRFMLEHVLRLDLLEDPTEAVEHTRRGAAFHRALARFHRWIKDTVPQTLTAGELPEGVSEQLRKQLEEAVEEYAARAPSAASRELWRLEGRRLARSAARYRGHWHEFRKPWQEKGATPTPFAFEADFGVPGEGVPDPLVISVGGVEVRIGGRIDRIDVAKAGDALGFWVIDYKTGRAANYSASQVERFEKLQLPLYALAAERVLFKDRPARPLGLAYWLVTDSGPKPMLPGSKRALLTWLTDPSRWAKFREQLEAWVATLVTHIRAGDFPLAPRSEHCTDTCRFGPICRISQSRNTGKIFSLSLPVVKIEPGV